MIPIRPRRLLASLLAGAGLVALLAVAFASAVLLTVRQPLSLGDYLAIWGIKARAIHVSGELSSVFRVDPAGEFSHPEYPPLWPLLLGAAAYTGLLLVSFAFARVDVTWLVTWTWDRLALLPVAALLPALFEAAAEPFEERGA